MIQSAPRIPASLAYYDARLGLPDASLGFSDASLSFCDASLGFCDARLGFCDARLGLCDTRQTFKQLAFRALAGIEANRNSFMVSEASERASFRQCW